MSEAIPEELQYKSDVGHEIALEWEETDSGYHTAFSKICEMMDPPPVPYWQISENKDGTFSVVCYDIAPNVPNDGKPFATLNEAKLWCQWKEAEIALDEVCRKACQPSTPEPKMTRDEMLDAFEKADPKGILCSIVARPDYYDY